MLEKLTDLLITLLGGEGAGWVAFGVSGWMLLGLAGYFFYRLLGEVKVTIPAIVKLAVSLQNYMEGSDQEIDEILKLLKLLLDSMTELGNKVDGMEDKRTYAEQLEDVKREVHNAIQDLRHAPPGSGNSGS